MTSSTPPATLTPAFRVLVNGQDVGGAVSADVTTTAQIRAGTFEAQIAYSTALAQQAAPWWDPAASSAAGAAVKLPVDIQMALLSPGQSLGAAAWQSRIQGNADHLAIDPKAGLVTVTGRDYLAALIDLRVIDALKNQTSSEIARTIAGMAGLQVGQIDSTTTLVGHYYQVEHTRVVADAFSRSRSAFELLKGLALAEGFDLYVIGQKLYFTQTHPTTGPVFPIVYTPANGTTPYPVANVVSITLDRDLTLSRGAKVVLRSWNAKQRKPLTATYPASASADAQTYPFLRPPNVPASQLTADAQTIYRDIVRHERIVHFTVVDNLGLSPRQRVSLSGTGTSFDQTYWIDSVKERISVSEGLTAEVVARNSSPALEALL